MWEALTPLPTTFVLTGRQRRHYCPPCPSRAEINPFASMFINGMAATSLATNQKVRCSNHLGRTIQISRTPPRSPRRSWAMSRCRCPDRKPQDRGPQCPSTANVVTPVSSDSRALRHSGSGTFAALRSVADCLRGGCGAQTRHTGRGQATMVRSVRRMFREPQVCRSTCWLAL